jgi:hypothetical protein
VTRSANATVTVTTIMGLTPAQKSSIEEIINVLLSATGPRSRRKLADLFVELVDKDDYPEYYEVSSASFASQLILKLL